MYAGLAVLFFFLVLFLQQVGGYTPLQSGLATLPVTLVMFALSRRFGALADRHGPRLFMGLGPFVAAVGLLLFQRVGASVDYVTDVLPALLVFSLGLSMTVAPLTAAVLAGAERTQAGIASAVNNAVARVAGLLGTAAVGAAIATAFATSLDTNLSGVRLGAAPAEAAVRGSQAPAARPPRRPRPAPAPGPRRAERRASSLAAFLPPRSGNRRGAGGPGRNRGRAGCAQPRARGPRRDVRGRGAGRGESGGGIRPCRRGVAGSSDQGAAGRPPSTDGAARLNACTRAAGNTLWRCCGLSPTLPMGGKPVSATNGSGGVARLCHGSYP